MLYSALMVDQARENYQRNCAAKPVNFFFDFIVLGRSQFFSAFLQGGEPNPYLRKGLINN